MLKGVVGLVAVLVIAGPAPAQDPAARVYSVLHQLAQNSPAPGSPGNAPADASAPEPSNDADRRLTQADFNVLADARIGMAKSMLQMTPRQADLWPPIEEAIRNALEVKYRRIAQLRASADETGREGSDPVAALRSRSEALSEEGNQLTKLAEAWQPLYQTLTPEQKDRMRLVTSHVLCETRGTFGCLGNDDEEQDLSEEE